MIMGEGKIILILSILGIALVVTGFIVGTQSVVIPLNLGGHMVDYPNRELGIGLTVFGSFLVIMGIIGFLLMKEVLWL